MVNTTLDGKGRPPTRLALGLAKPTLEDGLSNKKRLIGGAVLAVLAICTLYCFAHIEEWRVKGRFKALAEWVDKEPGEQPMETLLKAAGAQKIFADPCRFEIEAYEVSSKVSLQEIMGYAAKGRERFSDLHLKFYDVTVAFPEKGEAEVTATARLTGRKAGGDPVNETHEVECALKKTDDGWRFTNIKAVEVLKK